MARDARTEHTGPFLEQDKDFNEQLYAALKHAPWWMISIAVHVLILVLSSLLAGEQAGFKKSDQLTASMGAEAIEPDVPETPEETEQVQQDEVVAKVDEALGAALDAILHHRSSCPLTTKKNKPERSSQNLSSSPSAGTSPTRRGMTRWSNW